MKALARLHAESFNEVPDVVECYGHNGDIAANKD